MLWAVYNHSILENVQKIGDAMLIHLYSTNISTVYLALNQPEEALHHLETAIELAREIGGLALAETQRNRARAFAQLAPCWTRPTAPTIPAPLRRRSGWRN